MDVKFESKDMGKAKIERELRAARKLVALVGIPSDAKRHEDNPNIGLAEIAFIMEKGSTVNNIPPRPFMQQTRIMNEKKVAGLSKKYLSAISTGKMSAMDAIKKLGASYEGAMKKIFIAGTFAPDAPATARRKKSSRPLIDTGLLRQSIKYKVAKI